MNRLKSLRLEQGLTIRTLAEKTSINHATISRLENNLSSLNEEFITIFTTFFNVSSDYLLGFSENKNNAILNEVSPMVNTIHFKKDLSDYSLDYDSYKPTGLEKNNNLFWFKDNYITRVLNMSTSCYFDEINLLVLETSNLKDATSASLILAIIPDENGLLDPEIFTLFRPKQLESNEIFFVNRLSTGELIEIDPQRNKKDFLLIGLILKVESSIHYNY